MRYKSSFKKRKARLEEGLVDVASVIFDKIRREVTKEDIARVLEEWELVERKMSKSGEAEIWTVRNKKTGEEWWVEVPLRLCEEEDKEAEA